MQRQAECHATSPWESEEACPALQELRRGTANGIARSSYNGSMAADDPSVSLRALITEAVRAFDGVTVEAHAGGEFVAFKVGRREIGHLHGDRMADLPFPVRIREELVSCGRASLHYLHPDTGWVSYYLRGRDDVAPVVDLFRYNFERPWLGHQAVAAEAESVS